MEFIRNPPLNRMFRPGYRILFGGAVYSLQPRYRQMLGLAVPRLGPVALPVRLATKAVLAVVHLALGRRGPANWPPGTAFAACACRQQTRDPRCPITKEPGPGTAGAGFLTGGEWGI